MEEPLNEHQNQIDPVTENELKKIKLSLEHGIDLSKLFTSSELPPQIEGQFLDYIQQWEDQYAQRRMITIYDLVGQPQLTPVAEIHDEKISAALCKVMELLNSHSVSLDTLCEVEARELYRFITEELVKLEIDDIRIEGMMHHFTYEEFHPNHPYDIKNRCTEFIDYLGDKEKDDSIVPWGVADEITGNGRRLTKGELNDHVIRFRGLFNSLTLNECNYESVALNEAQDEGAAIVYVHYSGMADNKENVELTGNCIFRLKCEYEWWTIQQFEIPWDIV